MLIPDFTIPFITIALAELGDKSQILIFLLSSRMKQHFPFLIGVMLGFLVVDGFAIWIGAWMIQLVPMVWVKILSGFIFLILGLLMLFAKNKEEKEELPSLKNPFLTGFGLIVVAEWGDKTQIASALFAAQYHPVLVLIAVLAALLLLSTSAIYFGKIIAHRLNKRLTAKVGGALFVVLGLSALFF